VHSWPESQIAGGRLGEVTASAILGAEVIGRPMVAATAVQNFMKSLRVTPLNRFSLLPTTFDFICHLLADIVLKLPATHKKHYTSIALSD
jgi:hypothetical protein